MTQRRLNRFERMLVKALRAENIPYEIVSRTKHRQLFVAGNRIHTFSRGTRAIDGAKCETQISNIVRRAKVVFDEH
jgi:hypothetical protein